MLQGEQCVCAGGSCLISFVDGLHDIEFCTCRITSLFCRKCRFRTSVPRYAIREKTRVAAKITTSPSAHNSPVSKSSFLDASSSPDTNIIDCACTVGAVAENSLCGARARSGCAQRCLLVQVPAFSQSMYLPRSYRSRRRNISLENCRVSKYVPAVHSRRFRSARSGIFARYAPGETEPVESLNARRPIIQGFSGFTGLI